MKHFLVVLLLLPFAALSQTISNDLANPDSVKNANTVIYYTKVIKDKPSDASAYLKRGVAYLNLENYKAALADLTKVITLDKNNYEAWFQRGICKHDMENFAGAIEDYSRALLNLQLLHIMKEAYLNVIRKILKELLRITLNLLNLTQMMWIVT